MGDRDKTDDAAVPASLLVIAAYVAGVGGWAVGIEIYSWQPAIVPRPSGYWTLSTGLGVLGWQGIVFVLLGVVAVVLLARRGGGDGD